MIFMEFLKKQKSFLKLWPNILCYIRNTKGVKNAKEKREANCKITLYRNGFTIDNGPFRDYNDPKNKKFMAELNKG